MVYTELISVIVPVYNVGPYLEKCVKSILAQDHTDFGLYLIDDGSTDQSGRVCDIFAEKDPRIKVIHKLNGGLSDARNTAIDQMQGRYVVFIDPDDHVESDYLSTLYALTQINDADISMCDFQYVSESGVILNKVKNDGKITRLDQKEAIKSLLEGGSINTSACMKMYKTELFDDIRYPKGRLYEDIATTYKLFFKAERFVYQDHPLYSYVCRSGSITKQNFTEKRLDAIRNMQEMCDAIRKRYPEFEDDCDARLYAQYISTYSSALSGKADKAVTDQLYRELKRIKYNDRFKRKMRIYHMLSDRYKILFDMCILAEGYIQHKRKLGI